MLTSKLSKNFWAGALVASVALIGSVHADILSYSSEDFEAGIPNYTLTGPGPYTLTQLTNSEGTVISANVALAGTDYTPGSPSRSGVWANNDLPGTISNEPTGQHGFVSASQNRTLTSNYAMPLATDNAQSLSVSFDTMVYGNGTTFAHVAAVFYSALGDFSDSVMIATYATTNMATPVVYPAEPVSILGHTTLVEGTWSTLNLSISSADVTFADTAKFRFNKLPDFLASQMIFYDNITITAEIPSPATLIMLH